MKKLTPKKDVLSTMEPGKERYQFYTIVQSPELRRIDEFMHFCDVFEKGKRLGNLEVTNIDTNSKIQDEYQAVNALKELYEKAGGTVLLLLEKETGVNYVAENIQTISNGHQFSIFKKMLESLGYLVTTDEYMNVTSIYKECTDS